MPNATFPGTQGVKQPYSVVSESGCECLPLKVLLMYLWDLRSAIRGGLLRRRIVRKYSIATGDLCGNLCDLVQRELKREVLCRCEERLLQPKFWGWAHVENKIGSLPLHVGSRHDVLNKETIRRPEGQRASTRSNLIWLGIQSYQSTSRHRSQVCVSSCCAYALAVAWWYLKTNSAITHPSCQVGRSTLVLKDK